MKRGQFPIVVLLIVSLATAGMARRWALARSNSDSQTGLASSTSNLSQMNSFALALMLGGLRGPLVMFLWPSAEHQKNEHNLDDFDTKIEWIRLLQAEFDTVHIFQIWNKAYNISVQMANIGNKYQAILDALDYARSVDAERPNDINLLVAIAQVYSDKLGNSSEKLYYCQRVRDETRARQPMVRVTLPIARLNNLVNQAAIAGLAPSRLQPSTDDENKNASLTLPKSIADAIEKEVAGPDTIFTELAPARTSRENPLSRHHQLDPLVDEQGNLLPQLYAPKLTRPANRDPASEWDDGSELQYLKQFEPFPNGVSPLAIGYNYYKRAQVLNTVNGQKHQQISDRVIDSRPPIALKLWAEEEWARGRRAEIVGFSKPIPDELLKMELTTAEEPLSTPISRRALIEHAIRDYARTDQVGAAAILEFQRHLQNDKGDISLYLPQIEDVQAMQTLVKADQAYLIAMLAPAGEEAGFKSQASALYQKAAQQFELDYLKYYVPDDMLLRSNVTKADLRGGKVAPEMLDKVMAEVRAYATANRQNYSNWDELQSYGAYVARCVTRLKMLVS